MRKIPTLFVRDPDDRKQVLNEITPGCEWVLDGEGIATRKYDGTCVLIQRSDGLMVMVKAFVRREVKEGKQPPPNFRAVDHDDTTGKTVGWEPAEQSGFAKFIEEALTIGEGEYSGHRPGTYELCGPKIQGNPEGFDRHVLVRHGLIHLDNAPRTYDELREYLLLHTFEGIVWHHPDGRMVKLKKRDFA